MKMFAISDLGERAGELCQAVEQGQFTLMTHHGHPLFIGVPFNEKVIQRGVYVALADALFKSGDMSLGKAAKLAGMSLIGFTEHVSRLAIPMVNYSPDELDAELAYFL